MKLMSTYELQEMIENNIQRLISVYEDEICRLKDELDEAKEEIERLSEEKGDSFPLFRIKNGHDYLILDQRGQAALLVQLDTRKFVVAHGLRERSWMGASYWNDIHSAYERYEELK